MHLPRALDKRKPSVNSAADSTLKPSGNVFTCDQMSASSIPKARDILIEARYVPTL
jgi:hypothetical protein